MSTELIGHTSPDTAYTVEDYPYGFRLRTTIRYWIETKKGHGQRVVSQTRNPKRPGQPWNKPHAGTYAPILALFLDEQGHVQNTGASPYMDEPELDRFIAAWPLTCAEERNAKTLIYMRARCRALARVTWTVTSDRDLDPSGPRQSPEEQRAIIGKLTALELHKIRTEGEAK